MFLLVSVRHVGAHPDELQHGVSCLQCSINLGKTFPRISRRRIIPSTQILARVFVYSPPFISQILDFIWRMVLIFILIYFEWRDTENQKQRIYFIRITGLPFILEIYLKNSLLLCFEYVKKTERASRPRFRPRVVRSAKIATREKSDIASTSLHAHLCNSLALQSLKKKKKRRSRRIREVYCEPATESWTE